MSKNLIQLICVVYNGPVAGWFFILIAGQIQSIRVGGRLGGCRTLLASDWPRHQSIMTDRARGSSYCHREMSCFISHKCIIICIYSKPMSHSINKMLLNAAFPTPPHAPKKPLKIHERIYH